MIQCKAGMFRVDRCDDCGTNFQNPQLTAEGLSFYYRDFYDGSGEMDTEMMFSADWPLYRRRAHLSTGSPARGDGSTSAAGTATSASWPLRSTRRPASSCSTSRRR